MVGRIVFTWSKGFVILPLLYICSYAFSIVLSLPKGWIYGMGERCKWIQGDVCHFPYHANSYLFGKAISWDLTRRRFCPVP